MLPRRTVALARLVDADPSWVKWQGRAGMGIAFDCPIHDGCRLAVPFANPLDGGAPSSWMKSGNAWSRSGTTFDTLTLAPSVHVEGGAAACEWHGAITGGAFTTFGDAR